MAGWIEQAVFETAASFFEVPVKSLNRRTRIETLSRALHDPIVFSFEIEKKFGIEFEELDVQKVNTVGDYVRLLVQTVSPDKHKTDEGLRKVA